MNSIKDRLKRESKFIGHEAKGRLATYIGAAFGFVAGLAWNDAIRSLIEYVFPKTGNSILAKFSYAVIVTLVVVFITAYLMRVLREKDGV